jgi:gliding motility-associated-like protein
MKLKLHIFIICLLCNIPSFAQNLINNPSFEEHDCSKVDGNGNYFFQQACLKWTTPTWFTGYCTSFCPDLDGTPRNYTGYQQPHTGQSFVSLSIQKLGTDWGYKAQRTYISTRLKQTLKKDSIYQLELFVNQDNEFSRLEVELQVLFSDSIKKITPASLHALEHSAAPLYPHPASISLTPDFFVSDTLGWTRVCAIYKAKGGEKWLTIGNFDDDDDLKFNLNNRFYPQPYYEKTTLYFIDDVTLTPIQSPPFIDFNLGRDTIRCDAQTPYLLAVPNGMDAYLWNTGGTSNNINVNNDGKYWVLAYKDGCNMTDTVNVKFRNIPQPFSIPTQRYCASQLPITYTLPVSVQNGYQDFLWSDGTNNRYINISSAGIYTVTATSECNTFSTSFEVFTKNPILARNQDIAICANALPIVVKADDGFDTYLWNTGSIKDSLVVSQVGTYIVFCTLQECGMVIDTIMVRLQQPPAPLAFADTILCTTSLPLQYAINSTFTNIKWNDNATDNPKNITQSGTYSVSADWQCGTMRDTFSVTTETPLLPIQLLTQDTTSCSKGHFVPFRLRAPYGYPIYIWNTVGTTLVVANTRIILVQKAGEYIVKSKNICGNVSDTIKIDGCPPNYYIPNTFTPNDDGQNDVFTVFGTDAIINVKMQVFDRWGEYVFAADRLPSSGGAGGGWDGTFRGQPAITDVYVYVVVLTFADDTTETVTGDVTLLR